MTNLKHYSLTLREAEVLMLEKLKADGLGTREIFRHALRSYHDGKFPAYARKSNVVFTTPPDKTPEQKCTDLGGVIREIEGIPVCEFTEGGLTRTKPLAKL